MKQEFNLEALKISEWCPEFEKFMRNRLLMGSFRYGKMAEQDFNKFDLIRECEKRLEKYKKTRNLEYLVDAANMLMLQYVHGLRIGEKLQSIDDGEHSKELHS